MTGHQSKPHVKLRKLATSKASRVHHATKVNGLQQTTQYQKSSKKQSDRRCTNRGNEHHFHYHHATVISRSSGNNRIRKVLQTKLLRKHDRRGTVLNLSSKVVKQHLNSSIKIWTFVLFQVNTTDLTLIQIYNFFSRRIKLRAHFDKPDPNHIPSESELFARRDKNWTPRFNHHSVDTFISCVTKELKESKPNPIPHDNLSPKERQILEEFSSRNDIIIIKADKGGVTVILDYIDYVDGANRQLQDTQYYHQLNYNPTEDHTNIICNTLDEIKNNNELDKDIAEGLKPIEPRTPRFYLLPKSIKRATQEDP